MVATAFGHHLETLHDGLCVLSDGRPAPMPLSATRIAVEITRGLAVTRCTRIFRNAEDRPIEAILTMPVGFDTVVTDLKARIDGRELRARAQERDAARDSYEGALDVGRMAVVHEEVLRGVHMLSVGQIAPGAEVEVEIESVSVLAQADATRFLRLPMTVGQLYGASPLAPVDDLTTSAQVRHEAQLVVTVDRGGLRLNGQDLTQGEPQTVLLDAALEIEAPGTQFGTHLGRAADGRQVRLDLGPLPVGEAALDLAVLVDRSGSTGSRASVHGTGSVWQAIRNGLHSALGGLHASDRIGLWQFDDKCEPLGSAMGGAARALLTRLDGPRGGTSLGRAVGTVLQGGASDVLVLTDGQTWSDEVEGLMASKARVSAILVGPGSLDANIGRICAMTGGQVFHARGEDVGDIAAATLRNLRRPAGPVAGTVSEGAPSALRADRGGVRIAADWTGNAAEGATDAIGRFAAALAMPLLSGEAASAWAVSHGLCTHLTSLVLVDEAGALSEGLAQTRKVPLMEEAQPFFAIGGLHEMPPPSMDYMEAPMPARSMARMRPAMSMPDPAPRKQAEHRKPVPESQSPIQRLRRRLGFFDAPGIEVFAGFDWLAVGDALLAEDYDMLSPEQMRAAEDFARSSRVRDLADRFDLPPLLVALALIAADTAPPPASRRFPRKVFAGIPVAKWQP